MGNLSFEPEPGEVGKLNLVIPFDRRVQVARCPIVRHAANSAWANATHLPPSLRGAKRRSNPYRLLGTMDCFAEPVISTRALLRSSGARIRATRWLAMTAGRNDG